MRKTVNTSHIEGYIYEHKLEHKVSGQNAKNPGTEFVNGTLRVATDDALTNIVDVHFTYVTEFTTKGKVNSNYSTLMNIIDGKIGSVMEHGVENAGKVKIDSAIALNEWYDYRTQDTPLISTRRNEGGFIHIVQELSPNENDRATFETDMVITNFRRVEADPDRDQPEKGIVKGCIFNFRGELLPIEYSVVNTKALDYFESLGVSDRQPMFTKVKGQQVSRTVIKRIEEEGAWGEISVRETKSSQKDFVITWMQAIPYDWDTEETILASELSEKITNRELTLAELRRRSDEYQASKDNALAGFAAVNSNTEYKF